MHSARGGVSWSMDSPRPVQPEARAVHPGSHQHTIRPLSAPSPGPQRRSTNENSRRPPITCQDVMNQVCRPNTGAMRRIVALSACTPPDMSNVSPPARDSFHRLTKIPKHGDDRTLRTSPTLRSAPHKVTHLAEERERHKLTQIAPTTRKE